MSEPKRAEDVATYMGAEQDLEFGFRFPLPATEIYPRVEGRPGFTRPPYGCVHYCTDPERYRDHDAPRWQLEPRFWLQLFNGEGYNLHHSLRENAGYPVPPQDAVVIPPEWLRPLAEALLKAADAFEAK